jgi:hypothetical protein
MLSRGGFKVESEEEIRAEVGESFPESTAGVVMLKALLIIVAIIFVIGLLVVMGVIDLIF